MFPKNTQIYKSEKPFNVTGKLFSEQTQYNLEVFKKNKKGIKDDWIPCQIEVNLDKNWQYAVRNN